MYVANTQVCSVRMGKGNTATMCAKSGTMEGIVEAVYVQINQNVRNVATTTCKYGHRPTYGTYQQQLNVT